MIRAPPKGRLSRIGSVEMAMLTGSRARAQDMGATGGRNRGGKATATSCSQRRKCSRIRGEATGLRWGMQRWAVRVCRPVGDTRKVEGLERAWAWIGRCGCGFLGGRWSVAGGRWCSCCGQRELGSDGE